MGSSLLGGSSKCQIALESLIFQSLDLEISFIILVHAVVQILWVHNENWTELFPHPLKLREALPPSRERGTPPRSPTP